MLQSMTLFTKRNNGKIIMGFISQIMMIMLGRSKTKTTRKCTNFGQQTSSNGIMNRILSFVILGKTYFTSFFISTGSYFAFFALAITSLRRFFFSRLAVLLKIHFALYGVQIFLCAFSACKSALWAFNVIYTTFLALTNKSIFCVFVLREIIKRFNFFAFRTFFCCDCFRHNQFLNNWLCLEPVSRPILVSGSFYSIIHNHKYKEILR